MEKKKREGKTRSGEAFQRGGEKKRWKEKLEVGKIFKEGGRKGKGGEMI